MKERGADKNNWWSFHHDWQEEEGDVIEETSLTIFLNGMELISIMGTPLNQDWLAVGFLKNEGIINVIEEIEDLQVTQDGCCIDVWVDRSIEMPSKKILTSGCGGGVTYDDRQLGIEPIRSGIKTNPEILLNSFNLLQTKDSLYARARGIHAAGLIELNSGELIRIAEDIGRHNSIDKLHGACLLDGIPTHDRGLLTTGRISSEMLRKGAIMGCPVIASRTSPTTLAVDLARSWHITLVGYARHGKLRVYCNPERLGYDKNQE